MLKTPSQPKNDLPIIDLGNGLKAILDQEDYNRLYLFHWVAKKSRGCYYACRRERTGKKTRWIRMHREVTNCPKTHVVHHRNYNSLDNRKANLLVLTPMDHKFEHARRGKAVNIHREIVTPANLADPKFQQKPENI